MRILLIIMFLSNSLVLSAQVGSSCIQILEGQVKDRVTKDLLPYTIVMLSDKDGNAIESQLALEDAKFLFKIQCNTEYKIVGKKEQYTEESKIFATTDESNKELKIEIFLDKGQIDFIKEVNSHKKAGPEQIKIENSQDFIKDDILVIPDTIKEKDLNIEIVKEITNPKVIKINPIYFDIGSSYLNKKSKLELLKTIALMKKHDNMVIECTAHADSQGHQNFNKWLSDRRAKRTIDFIVKNGIHPDRIIGKSYGDTQLLNQCKKNIECTELEHSKNRRTEFSVVKM